MVSRGKVRGRLRALLAAISVGAGLGGAALARDLWVDPQGLGGTCDDAGPGDAASSALCSLSACLTRATPGDRCLLRAGRYVGSAVPAADGRSGAPIVIERYGDERVEIWGTVPLEGRWRPEADDVVAITTSLAPPLALIETNASGGEQSYAPWVGIPSKRRWRADRLAPGTFEWEAAETLSTIKLRRVPGTGDANASAWRVRVADLDVRERSSLSFEGIVFVDMVARLEGATDVRFDDCRFVRAGEPAATPRGANDPVASVPGASTTGGGGGPSEIEIGDDPTAGGDELPDPPPILSVTSGGTGASSVTGARLNLGAAADGDVVHLAGAEVIRGSKTFDAPVVIRELNGVKRSTGFANIAECVSNIPNDGGVCWIDPSEDDTLPFADTNPDLRPFSLVRDGRLGGARWLSSRPEPASGATEDQVPFVFQVRWNDPSRTYDDESGSLGEWNCGIDIPGVTDEWRNCPIGNVTRGSGSVVQPFWHTGQCNSNNAQSAMRCGGPHILEVRYPDVEGSTAPDKPVFAVGSGGASIYMPDYQDAYFQSALTIFRGRSSYFPTEMWNTPMYAFDKAGQFGDGGNFVGNSLAWPQPYTSHAYPPFNMWVQHDIDPSLPAFVVEGPGDNSPTAERGPIVKFYDRTGKGTYVHPGNAREAFGFYNDSRLYLGSFRNSDGGGQVVEWEGRTVDGKTTQLAATEPTAPRTITLPDMSGYVALAAGGTTKVTCGAVTFDPPVVNAKSTVAVTAGAPVVLRSACSCSPRADWADDLVLKSCAVLIDGTLTLRLYNADNTIIADGDTAGIVVDYCCTAK